MSKFKIHTLHQLKTTVPYKNTTNVHHVFNLLPPILFLKHFPKNSFLYKFYTVLLPRQKVPGSIPDGFSGIFH